MNSPGVNATSGHHLLSVGCQHVHFLLVMSPQNTLLLLPMLPTVAAPRRAALLRPTDPRMWCALGHCYEAEGLALPGETQDSSTEH